MPVQWPVPMVLPGQNLDAGALRGLHYHEITHPGLEISWCISQKDRLIYRFDDQAIYIFAIGGHYDQF